MEKFAVDLDKVLDDFEFNEDCAEQIASVACQSSTVPTSASKGSNTSVLNPYNSHVIESIKANKDLEVLPPFEKHKESLPERDVVADNLSYSKGDSMSESADSVNHFYPHDYANDNKITQKQSVQSEHDQVSLTIYNDISQKLLQKQQNGNSSPKIQNRYDKKINQPNIKPSISNVFNSLNEYINAPTVSVNYVDTMLEKDDPKPNIQSEVFKDSINASIKNTAIKDCNLMKNISIDLKINAQVDDKNSVSSITKAVDLPEYQNTLLPTLESVISDSIESSTVTVESVEQSKRSIIVPPISTQEMERTYENVRIDTKTSEVDSAVNKSVDAGEEQKGNADRKHVYENVNVNEQKTQLEAQAPVYENICMGNKEILPDPTMQLNTFVDTVVDGVHTTKDIGRSEVVETTVKLPGLQVPTAATVAPPDTDMLLPHSSSKRSNTVHQTHRIIGFNNIDDLSEEELSKYLAELEAEERINEGRASYENISLPEKHKKAGKNITRDTFQYLQDDEDANEAPIFESVVIGELPRMSEEELQEKAKKFPVIDYSKGSVACTSEAPADFLEKPNRGRHPDLTKITSVENVGKIKEKKSRATEKVVNQIGMDAVSNIEAVMQGDVTVKPFKDLHNDKTGDTRCIKERSAAEANQMQEVLQDVKPEPGGINNTELDMHNAPCETNNEFKTVNITNDTEKDLAHEIKTCDKEELPRELSHMNTELHSDNDTKITEVCTETDKPARPQSLDIVLPAAPDERHNPDPTILTNEERSDTEYTEGNGQEPSPDISDNSLIESNIILGKQPPFWVPDSDAPSCMLCDMKFTVLKRRHHCRACGKVLCNKCCNMKFRLEYQGNIDSRVCVPCYQLLIKAELDRGIGDWTGGYSNNASSSDINSPQGRQPNPNNPMEYCSTIPPLQQLAGGLPPPPTVMVPVGVLKREGSTKQRPEGSKSVMFSDGIRPGCDLTELDSSWDLKSPYRKAGGRKVPTSGSHGAGSSAKRQNLPPLDANTNSYIPQDPNSLPPTVTIHKGQISYHNVTDQALLYKTLKNECEPPVMFAINRNLYAYVKITDLSCCVNKICWNISSSGLACVGQDEVILLIETLPDETQIPKDLLIYINQIYMEAIKGNTITELGFSIYQGGNLLGSREHAGFLFIRQTLQCLQKIILPPAPFLVGLLIHRWETPWAKIFPLRLVLRLGAEYRYYPCPLVSVRFRNALYFEIGHTVMKVLADFRNFGYTLPSVRGLTIHLKNRTTDVMLPRNRYDQVIKGLNNSNDHVLAYASNFSITADSHLVCIQTNTGDESNYQTQAINIHNKPRTITGASFIVINGALKSSMGLSAKSSIVEDGLMVEIMPEKMEALKAALKNMQDFSIGCGKQGAAEPDETVNIKWVDNDTQFNLGVKSPIDGQLMDGIPSIRVHNGVDYRGTSRLIRWTEVFIIKSDDHPNAVHDPVDMNKLSESIARATCTALVKLLDLLATAGLMKLGVRTTIHPDNVGYEAGSEGIKLPPIYMNSLDNELIQVLHKAAQNSQDTHTILELIFYILDD